MAVGIAIHNIPEGLCVSIPIYYATGDQNRAFLYAFLSGLPEPIAALICWGVLAGTGVNGDVYGVLFGKSFVGIFSGIFWIVLWEFFWGKNDLENIKKNNVENIEKNNVENIMKNNVENIEKKMLENIEKMIPCPKFFENSREICEVDGRVVMWICDAIFLRGRVILTIELEETSDEAFVSILSWTSFNSATCSGEGAWGPLLRHPCLQLVLDIDEVE